MAKSMFDKMSAGHWFVLLGIAVLVYGVIAYSSRKSNVKDTMVSGTYPGTYEQGMNAEPKESEDEHATHYASADGLKTSGHDTAPSSCMNQQQIDPKDLLPPDPNDEWAHNMTKGNIQHANLLSHSVMKGQARVADKNPNLQIRPEPQIEKKAVGPWLNSTFESSPLYTNPMTI